MIRDRLDAAGVLCVIHVADGKASFEAALAAERFDLIISDYDLPGYDGVTALARAQAAQPDVPVILVSGTVVEEQAVACLQKGATDYLLKGHLERLVPAVQRALVEAETRRSRKAAEEALRLAEARMRFTLESAHVGVWDMDYATGALHWSEVMEAQYGLEPGTFGGTFPAFVERVHPDDRRALLATIEHAVRSGTDFSVLHRALMPDGTVRWLSGTGRVVLGDDGTARRAVGISQDVTERRMLEDQYRQAQKMEAMGRLAAGVAHDFNNLLTVILGFCELLLEDLAPGDRRQLGIGQIQKAGLQAAAMTRQLLTFSRKEIIEPTLLDLNAIVTDMQALLARLIGEDVHVVLALEPALALVKADRGQVEQIILNLSVNARDAMPKGGTLSIATANLAFAQCPVNSLFQIKPGPCVSLTVTDTGTGITPEVLARLFEPFFTTKGVGKGTGLGLATVHGIITRSGGSVTVDSEVGRGTSFIVHFPKADAEQPAVAASAAVTRPSRGVQTVLVVEDADGLRQLTKLLLERQGYTVLVAANADEACQLVAANLSIDLLLTDVVMPGASGPELVTQLMTSQPRLKVIYMSGYTDEAIAHHGVLDAGIAFLHKPFTADALGRKIAEVLAR